MTMDRFYPIFDHPDWLKQLLPLGVRFVQLRIKDGSKDDLQQMIAAAQRMCRVANALLVVNDHWQIAMDQGCGFVHLGQEDLDEADMPAIKRAGLRIGISTHDHDELERARRFQPDYIALGPVYPTSLKKMKWQQQGLERITEWKRLIGRTPLVAIGGMSVERSYGAFTAGADIVSAVTDITLSSDPEARVRAWVEVTR